MITSGITLPSKARHIANYYTYTARIEQLSPEYGPNPYMYTSMAPSTRCSCTDVLYFGLILLVCAIRFYSAMSNFVCELPRFGSIWIDSVRCGVFGPRALP